MRKTIVAGAIGNCVHVAGAARFLSVAEQLGYETVFLGAAVPVDAFVDRVRQEDPEIVGVSYRLTPEVADRLVAELRDKLSELKLLDRRFVFGGTPPVCAAVEKHGLFERCFDGLENPEEVWDYLTGRTGSAEREPDDHGATLLERLERKSPYPLLRHHFGLPSVEQTVEGAKRIAESGCVDVISIAPDQNAQESMFRPEEMNPALDGAGGVPVRSADDLRSIFQATRCGNYPLLRIYSGTRDLISWAALAQQTIRNAWAAVPLCWYNALDGRSKRTPEESIAENQACMRWHALRGIPVEVNEAHHWSLRDAHDTISVAASYLAAYNARAMGVSTYVAQYMFNTPAGTEGAMDLAKILAQAETAESLHGPGFTSIRQARAGLLHLTPRLQQAKGQLAASTMLALALRPHIIHVVGFCEGDHAAGPDDVIESCEIVRGVLRNAFSGMPDLLHDPAVQARKRHLLDEAEVVLRAIRELGGADQDPFASPEVLARAIRIGVLDAPHLKGNAHAAGQLVTRLVSGAVEPVDSATGDVKAEADRIGSVALCVGGS